MTDSNILNAELREDVGKGASRRLRHQGKIPAVIYGGKKDPATLTLEHGPLMNAASQESFYSSILEIKVADDHTQKVVVRDVHHHPYKLQIMHLDFMRVSAEEILKISVPIHFTGEDESEAGNISGVKSSTWLQKLKLQHCQEICPSTWKQTCPDLRKVVS